MPPTAALFALLLVGPVRATDGSCAPCDPSAGLIQSLQQLVQQVLPLPGQSQAAPTVAPAPGGPAREPATAPRPSPGQLSLGAHAAHQSVVDATRRHREQRARRGVGTHYGDVGPYHRLSGEEQAAWLAAHTREGQQPPAPGDLTRSSCVEWAMEHVRAYYEATGDLATWEDIARRVRDERLQGTSLARELQAAGWRALYLNADTTYTGLTQPDGEHAYSLAVVRQSGTYYDVPVDGTVLDWERHPEALAAVEAAPFFVVVARGGLHVTAGVDGAINELARGEDPNQQVIYQDPLRDIIGVYARDVYGGGEAGQQKACRMWGSGLVLLPPGT
ncbi:MAG: hypothetical protein ABIO70_13420 [Pseudomonadota bacterium]